MSGQIWIRDRQRAQRVDRRYLSRLSRHFLQDELHLEDFELGIYLLGDAAMAEANAKWLGHPGSTDVITFHYGEGSSALSGELLVCIPVAIRQAKVFRTTWQSEIVRYIVHGVLHLQGYDDQNAPARRQMKARENRFVRRLSKAFRFERLGGTHSPPPKAAGSVELRAARAEQEKT